MIRNTLKSAHSKGLDSLNLTPLTDVMLTLIILFLVLETHGSVTGFDAGLPSAEPVQSPKDPTVFVYLSSAHNLTVATGDGGRTPVEKDKLKRHLAVLRKQKAYDTLIISADSSLPYEEVVGIMDEAKMAGFKKISLDSAEKSGTW